MITKTRCEWVGPDLLMIAYHDEEWGVPVHDDRKLFEFLILEGAQAGLSWSTVLRKRENYRAAFDNFDAEKIAKYDDVKVRELLENPGIIRNRLKVNAAIKNAKAFLTVQKEFGSFDKYIWQFQPKADRPLADVDGKPIDHKIKSMKDIPATTKESDTMSKDLKKRGFTFVGSTICYAFMQAVGMVNDHEVGCFRYSEISHLR